MEDSPGGGIAKHGPGICGGQGIKKAESELGRFARGREFRIEDRRRGEQAGHCPGFGAAALGKSSAPNAPEVSLGSGEGAIFRQALGAGNLDEVAPALALFRLHRGAQLVEITRKLIEVMDLAEQVLNALEILAPLG